MVYKVSSIFQFGFDITKKADETNSDNSGEMGTRDSGQGGSDVDMNSLSELPVLDSPGVWAFLTLKAPIMTAAVFFHCFSEKVSLTRQRIHMKKSSLIFFER